MHTITAVKGAFRWSEESRDGGRAVHGIVPIAFEFRWAQYRVGLPREWPPGEERDSHQAGRRDARRWPNPTERNEHHTPPQGGEPERRRDKRRARRKAGGSENRVPAAAPAPAAGTASASADSAGARCGHRNPDTGSGSVSGSVTDQAAPEYQDPQRQRQGQVQRQQTAASRSGHEHLNPTSAVGKMLLRRRKAS
jgi:hypothetical protein